MTTSLKSINLVETLHNIEEIAQNFGIEGELVEGGAFGNGLINDTLAGTFERDGKRRRYVFQRINHHVFKNPIGLMENVERVCGHVRSRLETDGVDQLDRRCLTLLNTLSNGPLLHIPLKDEYWRCYRYINHCTSYDVVSTEEQAFEAAQKFGEFQKLVADLPGPRLTETIPDFHNTPKRFSAFEAAIQSDPLGRAKHCRAEIEFALSRHGVAKHLLELHARGEMPERITHNDTKLSNVLICDMTGSGMCVVDLDTVMPGLSLYDFGDMVRTCVSPGEEDTNDLSTIHVRMPMFEALARGFIKQLGGLLTPAEKANLAFAGKLLTFEVGIRFLTDYLLGDVYFSTKRPGHNLDRCRTQFHLVRSIEACEADMNRFVESLTGACDASLRFRVD
ncbi:MAG: phosphotransferase [Verrucomicrobiales bacterium]